MRSLTLYCDYSHGPTGRKAVVLDHGGELGDMTRALPEGQEEASLEDARHATFAANKNDELRQSDR